MAVLSQHLTLMTSVKRATSKKNKIELFLSIAHKLALIKQSRTNTVNGTLPAIVDQILKIQPVLHALKVIVLRAKLVSTLTQAAA